MRAVFSRLHSVSNAEFIEHVCIGCGKVGNGIFAQHKTLKHRLVDYASACFLIRSQWL
jgi:hypothetical protein